MDYPVFDHRASTGIPATSNSIGVVHESHIQSRKKVQIENPCKHKVFRLVYQAKKDQPTSFFDIDLYCSYVYLRFSR